MPVLTEQAKHRKFQKLTTEEKEWLKRITAWIADERLTVEDFDHSIKGHHEEIASHREHIRLLRIQRRLAQKLLGKGVRKLAKWKKEKGLPA